MKAGQKTNFLLLPLPLAKYYLDGLRKIYIM